MVGGGCPAGGAVADTPAEKPKLVLVLPPLPSVTVMVMEAVPTRPATAVMLTMRLNPFPLNEMFSFGTSAGSDDWPLNFSSSTGVSASATVNEMVTDDLPVGRNCELMGEMFGGELAGTAGGCWPEGVPVGGTVPVGGVWVKES